METKLDHITKTVQIWLSSDEKESPPLRESLKPLYSEYSKMGYTVAVFESGAGSLVDSTAALLLHNRDLQDGKAPEISNANRIDIA